MNTSTLFAALLTLVLGVGCSDEVTTHFKSLADAKLQRAFERGWLPPLLPPSSVNIIEKNDLDRNTGIGSFEYDISEREKYFGQLKSIGAAVEPDGSPQILVLVQSGARWEIELPARSGAGKYRVEPAGE